jgi:protein-S-isoprenylcysteine O-methyltransferase
MSPVLARNIVVGLWAAFALIWLAGALYTKRSARVQSWGSRVFQRGIGVLGILIGFTPYFNFGPITRHFLPSAPGVVYTGLALTVLGIGLAIWARFFLGGNWSGVVTVKSEHTLVRSGPYSLMRHPIYTGMLLGLLGTAVVYNEVRCLIAAALILLMHLLKIRVEEQFMIEEFGAQYAEYRRQVKALLPFVW